MTKRKSIIKLLLALFLVFILIGGGTLLFKSTEKAFAMNNPLRYDGVNTDQLESYYRAHWRNGQDSRVTGETSGKWSFGRGDVQNGAFTYEKATNFNKDNVGYSIDGTSHGYFWTQTLTAPTYTDSYKYQSMLVWEAEHYGSVNITGFLTRANSTKESVLQSQNNIAQVWLPFSANESNFNWVDGESYTISMYSVTSTGEATELWSETYTSEYGKMIDQTVTVSSGDKVVVAMKTNKAVGTTDTLALLSSQFTEQAEPSQVTELTPAYVFNNNMVLQRGKAVNVYGYGEPDKTVTVTFAGQSKTATVNSNGFWKATLDAMEASSTGRDMTISDGTTNITYTGVLVGEVWYCSGQSNMQYTLGQLLVDRGYDSNDVWGGKVDYANSPIKDYTKHTNYDKIRIYSQDANRSATIVTLGVQNQWLKDGWAVPSGLGSVLGYSAYAVGFALELQKGLDVPVGIVVSAVGGTSVEEWLAQSTIDSENLNLHYQNLGSGTKTKCLLYNGMTAPLNDYTVNGFLWYQGCSDAGHGTETTQWVDDWYNSVKALVKQFRASHGNVPVISQSLVQCTDWVEWKYIRQANYNLMKNVDGFYAVNGINYGMPYDQLVTSPTEGDLYENYTGSYLDNYIHPADKYGNSRDAAHIALTNAYDLSGYNSVAEYPVEAYKSGSKTYIVFGDNVKLKLSSGTTVNNLEGYNGSSWSVITDATINGNFIEIPSTSYTKFRYAAYNVMMENATNSENWYAVHGNYGKDALRYDKWQFNSENRINLFTEKSGLPDLAVFAVLEMDIASDSGKEPPVVQETFTLSVNNGANGSVKVNGATVQSSYVKDATLSIEVAPNTGYKIASVKYGGEDVTIDNADGFTFTKTISANTTLVVTYEIKTFTASVTSANGSVTGIENGSSYEYGKDLSITIRANDNYKIKSITLNGAPVSVTNESETSFTHQVTGTIMLQVTYESTKVQVTVGTIDSEEGSVSGIENGSYEIGKTFNVTITAQKGYVIKKVTWKNTDLTIDNNKTFTTTLTVQAKSTLIVTFEKEHFVATVNNDSAYGTVQGISNGSNYEYGADLYITITAKDNYKIKSITLNGAPVSVTNEKEMTIDHKVIGTITLDVKYEADIKTVTVTVKNDSTKGTITGVTSTTYNSGKKITVTITAKEGYEIKSVKFGSKSISISNPASTSFVETLTDDVTITVTYEKATSEETSGSCGSSIGGVSTIILSLLALVSASVLIYKKKEN